MTTVTQIATTLERQEITGAALLYVTENQMQETCYDCRRIAAGATTELLGTVLEILRVACVSRCVPKCYGHTDSAWHQQ
jgi:hypothetical protein